MARIIDPFAQFFDDNGDPLVDGFLHFYESGTNNTDKDTFADINETIKNANPVPLDGAGRCPNVFGTGTYNVISFTSSMAQIQQFDPVSSDVSDGAFSSWDSVTIYDAGDIVTASDGNYYRSLVSSNQSQDPTTSPGQWEQIKFVGVWNTNVTYDVGDAVFGSDGFLYVSRTTLNSANNPTTDTTNWRPGANVRFVKGDDIASATALTLGADGNYFDVTGTTTITSITGVGVGTIAKLHFDGILTLTHNVTDLILPGGANLTTAAGDEAEFIEYASGDWRMTNWSPADGVPIGPPSAANGSSMALISTQTASASATVDFTTGIDGTYDKYLISLTDVDVGTDGADLLMRLSQSGTFISGTSYFWMRNDILSGGTNSPSGANSTAQIVLANSIINSDAASSVNGFVGFSSPDNTTYYKHFTSELTYLDAVNYRRTTLGAFHTSTLAMDGIRFLTSSGNIASGVFRLYGIKDS